MIKVTRIMKEFTPEFMEILDKKNRAYAESLEEYGENSLPAPTITLKEGDMIEIKVPFYIHPSNIRVVSKDFDGNYIETTWEDEVDVTEEPEEVYRLIEEFWKNQHQA